MKQNSFKSLVLVLAFILTAIGNAVAVTAYPYPFEFTQPDGSVITIRLRGDEKVHWAETMDGYTLLNNGKDGWEYAIPDSKNDLVCSGMLAHVPQLRSAAETDLLFRTSKELRFSKNQVNTLMAVWDAKSGGENSDTFNPNGNKKLIMILIAYSDLPFTRTQSDFNALMNQVGYNVNGAVGSVKDFFLEESYGNFNITTDVVGPYTAAHDMAYYGAPNPVTGGHDIRAGELMTEAVQLADPDVDYSQYDNDGDGITDGVYIIYAGYGEASGASVNTIWPHAGGIGITLDGTYIRSYSCSNELQGTSGTNLTTIGVICHEFGHVCGSPDYYDTDYETDGQYDGTGSWDLMAGGSWNGTPGGNCPPHMVPIEKIKNGWVTPLTLTTDASVSLPDVTVNPAVFRFNTTTEGEYFLLENRQKTGFNAAVPGHGMMIYHVDENYIATAGNKINCTSHQGMFPMSGIATNANGVHLSSDAKINKPGCPWPGTSARTTFSDATIPNALSWAGGNTNSALVNISEASGVISFCFKSCPLVNPAFNLSAEAPNGNQIDLSWLKNAQNNDVILAANTSQTIGDPLNGTNYNVGDVLPGGGSIIYKGPASAFSHTGLAATTTYYYKLWSLNGTLQYSGAVTVSAQTLCSSITAMPYTEGFEGGVIPGCWTQSNIIGANPWGIATSGINGNPLAAHGGTKLVRCNVLIQNAGYVTKLISPPLDITGVNNPILTFWHTQTAWSGSQDILRVYYRTSGTAPWNELAIYNSSISAWTRESITLPEPSANYFIAFEATVNAGYGVCIDDIMISAPVADFTVNSNVGCTGSLTASFTDNSIGPDGSWAWDIDNNGTTDYTTQNPSHTYNTPGIYSVKLTINNGAAQKTKENYVLVMAGEPTASTGCTLTSNSNSGNNAGIGIYRFALGNIDNSTSHNDGYYNNYACSKWTLLELGKSYNVTIRTGTSNNEGAIVYIDYNDNGTFETGEAIVLFPANKEGTRTLSFTTPSSGVLLNKGLRLRVLSKFSSIPSTACDIGSYGQAEDYTVFFINNIVWTGTVSNDWNTSGNWSSNSVPGTADNADVPAGAPVYPVINTNTACTNLTIHTGASVTVNPGKSLTVNGTLTNNAGASGLVVESGGSLIENTAGVHATVKREFSSGAWHLISVPNAVVTANTFFGDYLQYWDETGKAWHDIIDPGTGLDPIRGYGLWNESGDVETIFTGILNTGSFSTQVTVTGTSGISYAGANLLGNPYPCSVDWEGLRNPWGAVYYWNGTSYVSWNGSGDGSRYVPPMQGFFIYAPNAGTFSLSNANKAHSNTSFYKSADDLTGTGLVLATKGESYSDKLYITFNESAGEGFDVYYDAYKLLGGTDGVSEIYSLTGDTKLSIDVRPVCEMVPIGFANSKSGQYQVGIDYKSGILKATLEDTKNGTFNDLLQGNYSFSYQAGETDNRFKLHLATVGLPDNENSACTIYSIDKTVRIILPGKITGTIYLYNLAGQIIAEKASASGQSDFTMDTGGIYLVKVVTNNGLCAQKVWVR